MDRFVFPDKGDFIGRDAMLAVKEKGVDRKLVGYEVDSEPIVVTPGTPIEIDGNTVGKATFAAYSPTLDKVLGLGYVPVEYSQEGSVLTIVTETEKLSASVVGTPFFDPKGKRIRI